MKSYKIAFIVASFLCLNINIMAQDEAAVDYNKVRNEMYVGSLTSVKKFYTPSVEQSKNGVLQDNELGCSGTTSMLMTADNTNPLRLDGLPLDFNNFYLGSKGVLSVMKNSKAEAIPFYVSIRRDGKVLDDAPFTDKVLYKIDLSELFKYCKPEDRLIIKPVNAEDWTMKRILRLIQGC